MPGTARPEEIPAPPNWPDLTAVLDEVVGSLEEGARWTFVSHDLHLNVIAWSPPHGVAVHVNRSVDVLLVGLRGEGVLEIEGASWPVAPGRFHLIPRGTRRSIRAVTRLVYLTCHRRVNPTYSEGELFGTEDPGRGHGDGAGGSGP